MVQGQSREQQDQTTGETAQGVEGRDCTWEDGIDI